MVGGGGGLAVCEVGRDFAVRNTHGVSLREEEVASDASSAVRGVALSTGEVARVLTG